MFSFADVVRGQRGGLRVIDIEARLDGLEVVVRSPRYFPAFDKAGNQFVVVDLQVEQDRDIRTAFVKHFFQGNGLRDGAGVAVEDDTFRVFFAIEELTDQADNQLVRNELPLIDVCLISV